MRERIFFFQNKTVYRKHSQYIDFIVMVKQIYFKIYSVEENSKIGSVVNKTKTEKKKRSYDHYTKS